MEQFDALLVLMERTFYNVVPEKAAWLIDNLVESVGQPSCTYFGSDKFDLVII